MYLNEEEAKKKDCPVMTRIGKFESILSNRIIKCLASYCVMWARKESHDQGYCGLTNKPKQ